MINKNPYNAICISGISALAIEFALLVSLLVPSLAFAQAASTCIEDGGQAECTASIASDYSGNYSLDELRPWADTALWPGLVSEQAISNTIASLSPTCPTNQSTLPPYTWTVQPYNGDGFKEFVTPNISATLWYDTSCTQPAPRTFYGQKQQLLSCPLGWTPYLSSATTSYPFGYCYRTPVPTYYLSALFAPAAQIDCCNKNSVGHPINPASGTMFDTMVDAVSVTNGIGFKRFYNSTDSDDAGMSTGWRHSYSRSVTPRYDNALLQPWVSSPNNSSMYGDPATACTTGFSEIQGQLKLSTSSVTATYSAGVCLIKSGGAVITALPIYSTSTVGLIIQTIPIAYDVTRDDGQLITFWLNNTSVITPPSINLQLQQTSTGFTITDANDNVEQYDTNGKLLTVTSRGGVVQTMNYDGSGRLSNVSDSFGHQLSLNYNTQNQLTTVTRQ